MFQQAMTFKRTHIASIVIVAAIVAIIFLGRSVRREGVFYPMGGIPMKVVEYGRTYSQFATDMESLEGRVEELEGIYSRHRSDSELARMNESAGLKEFNVSGELLSILKSSKYWASESGGAFDPSVAPLIELWRGAGERGLLPSSSELLRARSLVGFEKLMISDSGKVEYLRDGMAIDLGAIAKGGIVDAAAELLKSRGVKRGVVEAGGDCVAFGDGKFRFGIQDPNVQSGDRLIGTVEISAEGIVTSGNYERFVEIEGKRFTHIIDPRSGIPIDNGLVSVTTMAPTSIDADAIATALMVMGRERGIDFVISHPVVKAIFIERGDEGFVIYASAALEGNLRLDGEWGEKVRYF